LLERAREDTRIVAAAITGSAARGEEDEWSDVDLGLAVANGVEVDSVLDDWTAWTADELGAIHHWDLVGGGWTYRVFLLRDALEIDLGFAPAAVFGSRGPSFRLVFGEQIEQESPGAPEAGFVIGLAWHHVLHARSALGRGKPWLAEWLVGALRDHVLELACLRLDLPTAFGRGFDALPDDVRRPLEDALVRSLDAEELRRALEVATAAFVVEVREHDAVLAERLAATLRS
jgi:hypothetical protein